MDFEFKDRKLEDVYYLSDVSLGHGSNVDRKYRKLIGSIKASVDERDLYALKALHYEKLKGDRSHQHSLRIVDQWRLIVERNKTTKKIVILIIEVIDYH